MNELQNNYGFPYRDGGLNTRLSCTVCPLSLGQIHTVALKINLDPPFVSCRAAAFVISETVQCESSTLVCFGQTQALETLKDHKVSDGQFSTCVEITLRILPFSLFLLQLLIPTSLGGRFEIPDCCEELVAFGRMSNLGQLAVGKRASAWLAFYKLAALPPRSLTHCVQCPHLLSTFSLPQCVTTSSL